MSDAVKDSRGRTIEVREIVGSARSRLFMAMGRELTDSPWAVGSIGRATVRSVDNKPTPPMPTTLDQIHALWDLVDEDAAIAAIEWLGERSQKVLATAGESTAPLASETASGS